MNAKLLKIANELNDGIITEPEAKKLLLNLLGVMKRYYWLKSDGSISNMWGEEDHKKYITDELIKEALEKGWQCIQLNIV